MNSAPVFLFTRSASDAMEEDDTLAAPPAAVGLTPERSVNCH